jgi:hypothetical protein
MHEHPSLHHTQAKKVESMDVIKKRKLMKKTLKSIVLLGALCGASLHATFQFRSPLSLEDRGFMHWVLAPADQAWWYDQMPSQKEHTDWNIHFWGAAYVRNACDAFAACGPCDEDKVTRHTTSLGELFFGKAVFRGEEVFAGGTFAGPLSPAQELVNSVNPFLAFARIRPVFDYNETGAHIGVDFARSNLGCDGRYHVGGRVYIPYKIIEIEQDTSIELQETLDDVLIKRIVQYDEGADPDQVEYAMRFDFLSTLVFNSVTTPSQTVTPVPVVRYSNSPVPGLVTISGYQASGDNSGVPNLAGYMTKSTDGLAPSVPFRRDFTQVTTALGADGEGIDGETYFMSTAVNYAGNLRNDRDAQGTLFFVPRSLAASEAANPADVGQLTTNAQQVLDNIEAIVDADLLVAEPASTFFLDNGINLLAHECIHGVGDLFTEVYGGIGHYDDWFVDGIFGVQFPTGKSAENARRIYYQTTGNNGHVVVCLGLDGGWKPCPWFAFEIRPYFYHACKRSENRAAPFAGQRVINIGPEINVDVSWNYFVFRTDFSFFHPHNPDLGFQLGYELFAKGNDHVSLGSCIPCNDPVTTDLLGRIDQPLNVEIYEHHTNTLTNKLRGQIFYRSGYFEIFGGGTQIVSGRHAMKESEGHLGLTIYF